MRINIDFSPGEHVYARKVYAVLALCLFAAASAFAVGYADYSRTGSRVEPLMVSIGRAEARSAELVRKLLEIKKTVDPSRAKDDALQVAFVNQAIRQKAFSWTAFLNRIEDIVPEGVGITSLRPDFSTLVVDISGSANDMDKVLQFIDGLTKSRYFDDIPPTFQSSEELVDKDVNKTLQKFSLRIQYYPDGRPEVGAAENNAPEKNAGHGG